VANLNGFAKSLKLHYRHSHESCPRESGEREPSFSLMVPRFRGNGVWIPACAGMTTFYKIINLNSLILFHSIHSKIYRLEIWRCQTQKEISLPIEQG
jgi:hypothetical protein